MFKICLHSTQDVLLKGLLCIKSFQVFLDTAGFLYKVKMAHDVIKNSFYDDSNYICFTKQEILDTAVLLYKVIPSIFFV